MRHPGLTAGQRRWIRDAALGPLLRGAGDLLGVPPRASLGVRLTDDSELRELNERFLGIGEPTDVLAFPGDEAARVGDVAVSVERAALQRMHDPAGELRLLTVHGLLHCLGYDHADGADAARMTAATRRILAGEAAPSL